MTAPHYAIDNLKDVMLFATDFDGVHTNGMVLIDQYGVESVRCNRRDGLGYDMLKKAGVAACIISKEGNPVVSARANKLGIPCYRGVETGEDKLGVLQRVADNLQLTSAQVLYIGDDINDLLAIRWVGLPVCPIDAHGRVREYVRSVGGHVSRLRGGEGVIREAVEMILSAKGLSLMC